MNVQQLLALPGPKFEAPLPPLPQSEIQTKNEKLQHITKEELMAPSLESSCAISISSKEGGNVGAEGIFILKPEEDTKSQANTQNKEAINVIDYNGSGKEAISSHHLSIDNEDLVPEKEEDNEAEKSDEQIKRLKSLEIIQENNSELSNSNSLISGRSVKNPKRQSISSLERRGSSHQHREPLHTLSQVSDKEGNKKPSASFCSARAPRDEVNASEKIYKRPIIKTSRNNSNNNEILVVENDSKSDTAALKKKITEDEEEKKPLEDCKSVEKNKRL